MRITRPKEISGLKIFSLGDIRNLYRKGEIRSGNANLEPVETFLAGEIYPLSIVHSVF